MSSRPPTPPLVVHNLVIYTVNDLPPIHLTHHSSSTRPPDPSTVHNLLIATHQSRLKPGDLVVHLLLSSATHLYIVGQGVILDTFCDLETQVSTLSLCQLMDGY